LKKVLRIKFVFQVSTCFKLWCNILIWYWLIDICIPIHECINDFEILKNSYCIKNHPNLKFLFFQNPSDLWTKVWKWIYVLVATISIYKEVVWGVGIWVILGPKPSSRWVSNSILSSTLYNDWISCTKVLDYIQIHSIYFLLNIIVPIYSILYETILIYITIAFKSKLLAQSCVTTIYISK